MSEVKQRHMVAGLVHKYAGLKDEEFFSAIDSCGGWPLGYRYVGFEHTDSREAGFTNSHINTGWWTVVADADDYHLWKLSPRALQRITDAVVCAIRLPNVDAQKLFIRNRRGYRAAIAATGQKGE
jgi:hypothetical protein